MTQTRPTACLHAMVSGRVQGVYFRAFVQSAAIALGLSGWVRNLADSDRVELEAEGDEDRLKRLVERLKAGPPRARVDRVELTWSESSGRYSAFEILY